MDAAAILELPKNALHYKKLKWHKASVISIHCHGYDGQPFKLPVNWLELGRLTLWRDIARLCSFLVNEPGVLKSSNTGQPVVPDTPWEASVGRGEFEYTFTPSKHRFSVCVGILLSHIAPTSSWRCLHMGFGAGGTLFSRTA